MAEDAKPLKAANVEELTRRQSGSFVLDMGEEPRPDRLSVHTLKEMRRDGQIALGLELVKAPLYAAPWRVECKDTGIAAYVKAEFDRVWRTAVRTALRAVDFGFAPHEILWSQDGAGVHLKTLKDLDPQHTTLLRDRAGDYGGFRWNDEVVVPAEKTFVMTHWKEFGNLYGVSRMTAAYPHWDDCRDARKQLRTYLRRRAIPPIKGRAPAERRQTPGGAEVDCIAEHHKNLMTLQSGGVATMPSEYDEKGNPLWDAELMSDNQQRSDDFLKPITYHDTMKLRSMMVPERTATQDGKGALAMAEAHTEMFLILEDMLLFDLVEQLNLYVVTRLVDYNFGLAAPDCRLVTDGLSEKTKALMRSIVEKLLTQRLTAALVAETLDVTKVLQGSALPLLDEPRKSLPTVEGATKPQPAQARRTGEDLLALSGIRDVRDAIAARSAIEGERHFDALLESVKKN